jgi:DNA-binding transcriptional LysR family regulator
VLAVRRDHPAGARLKKLDAFLAARHIAVVARGCREDMIDAWLRQKGIERPVALTVPGYLDALHVAAQTDLVAFAPRRFVAAAAAALQLRTIAPPLDPGVDEQFMFYPTRAQVDPGSIWLRKIVRDIGRAISRAKAA